MGTQGGASAPDFDARFKALSKKVGVKNPDMKDVNEFARMSKIFVKKLKKH